MLFGGLESMLVCFCLFRGGGPVGGGHLFFFLWQVFQPSKLLPSKAEVKEESKARFKKTCCNHEVLTRWWFQTFFIFTNTNWNDPVWRAYFSNGLVQPPTSYPPAVGGFRFTGEARRCQGEEGNQRTASTKNQKFQVRKTHVFFFWCFILFLLLTSLHMTTSFDQFDPQVFRNRSTNSNTSGWGGEWSVMVSATDHKLLIFFFGKKHDRLDRVFTLLYSKMMFKDLWIASMKCATMQ